MKKVLFVFWCFISFSDTCYATTEEELAILKQQIALLQRQIKALEQKISSTNKESKQNNARINQEHEKIHAKIKGIEEKPEKKLDTTHPHEDLLLTEIGKTKINFSGFFKLTGICDVAGSTAMPNENAGAGRNYLNARTIGLRGTQNPNAYPPSRDFYMHARETRFTISTETPIDEKDLSTCFEMDFLGDPFAGAVISNGYNLRLRKAYAKYNGFTVGQDWSTFVDIPTFPETVDRNGPVGNCQVRQPLIRYTVNASDKCTLDFAIENPESEFIARNGAVLRTESSTRADPYNSAAGIKGENRLPDFVAAMKYNFEKCSVKLSGLFIRNSIFDKNKNTNAHVYGGAVSLSFLCKSFKNDNFVTQLGYGYGAGRYFTDSFNTATYYDGEKLHNQRELHLSTGYKHQWEEKYNIRSTIALGYLRMMNCKALKDNYHAGIISQANTDALNTHVMSLHLNLMGNINKNTEVGLEYILAKRKTEAGLWGILRRITFAVQVNF